MRKARLTNPTPSSVCNSEPARPWSSSPSAGCIPRRASTRPPGLMGGSAFGTPPDTAPAALGRVRGLGGPAAWASCPRSHSMPHNAVQPNLRMPAWGAGRGAQGARLARCASADAHRSGRGRAAPPHDSGSPSPGVPGLSARLRGSAADAAQWLHGVGKGAGGAGPGSRAGRNGRPSVSECADSGAAGAGGAGGRRDAHLEERFVGFLARQQAFQQACCPGSW